MSGFVLQFNRDGAPSAPQLLDAALSTLDHRGPDGNDTLVDGAAALGHQHFWVTPEETNERQPLTSPDKRYSLLFDGRIDNRAQLLGALGIAFPAPSLSDAALLLRAYATWGDECLPRLIGPFALALYDRDGQQVTLARDATGVRSLFYHLSARLLVVGSEAQAVLAHPAVSSEINETGLARWYALHFPLDGQTIYQQVSELQPGHAMTIGGGGVRRWRYWQPDPDHQVRYPTRREYAERYLELLSESVSSRLRTSTPPALTLSGGYDSTSLAALAARELASKSRPPLRTISWIFDELQTCDERPQIEAVNQQYATEATFIPADDAYPLRDWHASALNPGIPATNAYRALFTRTYRAAQQAGSRTILSGAFGNQLFSGAEYWLLDLLREGRIGLAWRGLRHTKGGGHNQIRQRMQRAAYWRVAGWLLDNVPGGRRLRPKRQPTPPHWLTPYALERLQWTPEDFSMSLAARPEQYYSLLQAASAPGPASETFHAAQAGVEWRFPYRDRRLIEFMLAIPAHQLYDNGRYKAIVYHAMQDILPPSVRAQPGFGNLGPLFRRGLVEREQATVQRILDKPDALWRRYLRPEALAAMWDRLRLTQDDGPYGLAVWVCVASELWSEQHL